MGAYFSLHEANEWIQVVSGMPAPSIWSHAAFSPLTREHRVLLERRTAGRPRVEHAPPHPDGLKIGEDIIMMSEASKVSLLMCFEEKAGRLYSALLLTAPESAPHVYRRAVEEVVLRAPGSKDASLMQSSMDSLASPSSRGSRTLGRGSPLTTHNPLAATGRRLIDRRTRASLVDEVYYIHNQAYTFEDLQDLVARLPSTDGIERIEGITHQWAEDPKTVGALAGCQLAILARSEAENPGVKEAILRAGAVPQLVEFLRSPQQDRVQVGVVALGLLADANVEVAEAAKEAGAVSLLLRLMKTSVAGLRAAAAMTLENVTVGLSPSRSIAWHAPHVHVGAHSDLNPQAGYDSLISWLSNIGLHGKGLEFQRGRQSLSKTGNLEMHKLVTERPRRVSEFTYLLLYNVKEGILVHFGHDRESCEEAAREIAMAYGIVPKPLGRSSPGNNMQDQVGPGTAAAANLAASMRVKCVEFPVGCPLPGTITYNLTTIIQLDLARHFAVKVDPEEQNEHTNCVIFCQRALMELRLTLRGYNIKRACEERADLGSKVGEAAAAAWENLYARTGANRYSGLVEQPVDASRSLTHSSSAPALRRKVKFATWQLESLPDYTKFRVQDSQPVGPGSRWKQLHQAQSNGRTQDMYASFCSSRRF
eukprot:TRINITY_DN63156_c0_g1_i1.p1 TRINITY_DN63156_c0_g1~~TRINITY_DN63156_c0_g1_i1.p1  ORF type:complete len:649 (+),score=116.98 TRINITY_DN63156_c0_g1_i1:104-2050(+)